jgi:hypothetical protein
MKRLFVAIAVLGALSCHHVAARPSAEEAIDEAKALQQRADSIQGGWMTTDELIAKAEAALAQGDRAKALALANQAKNEAVLAYRQAEEQRHNWSPPPYLSQQ